MSAPRVAVIGCGLTGSFTALILRRALPEASVTVWEKSTNAGRTFTKRTADSSIDMGAQYISQTPEYAEAHKRFYSELLDQGILSPFCGVIEGESRSDKAKNFVAPKGMDSIVNYCVAASGQIATTVGCSVLYNTRLEKLSVADDGMIKMLTLKSENGYVASYNAVVITIPVPQALALDGVLELLDKKPILKKNLECVHYSSRYAVALHFESDFEIPVPWTAKYVCGNDAIRFVCWDSRKRNPQSGGPHSLLVHSSVPFAVEHLEEERAKVEETLIDRVQMLFSWLPKPTWSRCHRWRYSQVKQSYSGIPGYVTIGQSPPLLFGGDGFNHSNFDGCVESAVQIVNALSKMPILSL